MSNKAEARSISFKPASLYSDAEKYGKTLTPPRSPSAIVCAALTEHLRGAGALSGDAENELFCELRAALAENPALHSELEEFIRLKLRAAKSAA